MSRKDKFLLFFIFAFALLASRDLFRVGYFPMHDDLQMMRQLQMEKCFLDGQIPCRWVPDMGYGFGFPLFNFYPPLPYLIGEIFRVVGFSFVNTAKFTFALSIIVSGIAMYLLAKEFFGRIGGALSSVFYIWAPYHAVDVYVRGAMNESWALAWLPLIFWSGFRLLSDDKKSVKKWLILHALAWFALFTSHNLMVLILTPFYAIWILIWLWQKNRWARLPQLVISGIWALGLASFFTFPALLENKFTQIRGQLVGYYDYTAHFVSLRQLFITRFWGYGPSVWVEADDGMSFQIGHLHWVLALIVGGILIIGVIRGIRKIGAIREIKRIKKDPILLATFYMLLIGWFAAYLTHLKSIWIYQKISQLSFIQFPWRFLTIVIFTFSFVVGVIPAILRSKKRFFGFVFTSLRMTATMILIIIIVVVNWNYFKVERMGLVADEEKFSGEAWRIQQTAGIYDYLPVDAETAPKAPRQKLAEFMEGEGEIKDEKSGTDWAEFRANVESEEAVIRIGIFKFPNWRVFVNGKEVENYIGEDEKWGRMYIKLPEGIQNVRVVLENTTVRTVSNVISLASWLGLLVFMLHPKYIKRLTNLAK